MPYSSPPRRKVRNSPFAPLAAVAERSADWRAMWVASLIMSMADPLGFFGAVFGNEGVLFPLSADCRAE